MFSDEAWYDIEQAHNTQNDRNWSEQPLPLNDRIIPRQQHPKQVMVWAGVGHGVKTPLFFVPAGVSINGEVYREFLRTEVFPWARRHYEIVIGCSCKIQHRRTRQSKHKISSERMCPNSSKSTSAHRETTENGRNVTGSEPIGLFNLERAEEKSLREKASDS
uniref:Transposase n=1 Tax=Ditylenchus dipsaci TaxID=166011 RepID=A0A915D0H5_9BILA